MSENINIYAIHKDLTDGTYFFLTKRHYLTLHTDPETSKNTFSQIIPYSSIEGINKNHGDYMGFQPSFNPSRFLLALGNRVVYV